MLIFKRLPIAGVGLVSPFSGLYKAHRNANVFTKVALQYPAIIPANSIPAKHMNTTKFDDPEEAGFTAVSTTL